MPDLTPFRGVATCLLRPERYRAVLTLCGSPLTPAGLADLLGVSPMEVLPLLADLQRAGLVYERAGKYRATDLAFRACYFAAGCARAKAGEAAGAVVLKAVVGVPAVRG